MFADKIKKYYNHTFVQQFKDLRFVGFVVFGILVLLVTWSGVSVIESNYRLQRQVSELQQEIDVAKLANSNLKLQNEYYNSSQYLELTARRQFGKGQPGETLLLVPESVALKYTKDIPEDQAKAESTPTIKKPLYQRNIEAWLDFFTHKQSRD